MVKSDHSATAAPRIALPISSRCSDIRPGMPSLRAEGEAIQPQT
jgi:hypothetical protein